MAGHPLLWPQEMTSAFFIYGVFIGASAATRRNDHLQLLALTKSMSGATRRAFEVMESRRCHGASAFLSSYGWQNFFTGFGSFRMPSMLPIAYLYAPIPLCGALVALFSLEQIINGLRHGFEAPPSDARRLSPRCRTAPILLIMTALFLALGYLGVPVAFSLMAGVIVGTMLTPISLQSIVGQAFNGVDSEALMAIPFFLLVGELMTSANVVVRIAELRRRWSATFAAALRK